MIPPADRDLLISYPGQGKEVSFAPILKEQGLILKRAARQGFYYPMMAMKHLNALSTGLNGKRNVFIPNINNFKVNALQQVVVFVPGIKATVERRANDSLVVVSLELDPNESYKSIERGSMEKPGVYQVAQKGGQVNVLYKNNGRITPKDERKVAVADTGYDSPQDAADAAALKLEAMFGAHAALKCDFDLFYSPVGSRLRGMRNYNASIITQGYAFAGLLADAMEKSVKQTGVVWASEGSGSVVLTQSLQILARKKVPFAEQSHFANQNHIVAMHMPTTNPNHTLAAANQLGMIADKNMAKGNAHFTVSLRSMMTNMKRAGDKQDPYTYSDYRKELANGTMTGIGAAGALALGASLIVSAPELAMIGSAASTAGALHVGYNVLKRRFS